MRTVGSLMDVMMTVDHVGNKAPLDLPYRPFVGAGRYVTERRYR